ncbi:kinase-like domain-containing protein [Mycena maculata]|uniref:Kinase-like domain-containing protein n=1 Tax=Mycena maculata TaxID=230809 RepID=A0AAD7ML41_9AGAR|nr:kinase-like domain-containing protein [Mycena maculata]
MRIVSSSIFGREALVWHYLRHPNVVPFLGVDFTTLSSPLRAMVSPWMPLGNVVVYVGQHSPVFTYALDIINDVIQGLKYLHSKSVVHGDLCGRNILIDKDGRACLSDFGLAVFIDSETKSSSAHGGSLRWMAPELVQIGVPFKRTTASDVWAFGCVCGEVCCWFF